MDNVEQFKVDLFKRHYARETESSPVVSSFWQEMGGNNSVYLNDTGDRVMIHKGYGFGDFIRVGSLATLKYIVPRISLNFYLGRYVQKSSRIDLVKDICRKTGRIMSYDCCKQLVAIESLLKNIDVDGDEEFPFYSRGIKRVCIIGDGYGFMGSLLKKIDPKLKVVWINLGQQLLFDMEMSNRTYGKGHSYQLLTKDSGVSQEADFTYIEAENAELVTGLPVNLFINVASFQEMNLNVVEGYFDLVAKNKAKHGERVFLYSVNRVEKVLPDGTVIRSLDFPWKEARIVHEDNPEWYTKFPTNLPPFWHPFDGIQHERLAEF